MDEDDSNREHGSNPIPSSATAILTRVTISALKSAGYDKAADMIANGPEKLGNLLGKVIQKIAGKRERGEEITTEDEQALAAAIAQEPIAATAIVGAAIVTAFDGAVSASSENQKILEGYKFVLDLICEGMRTRQTSIALAGFLQGSDCVSYWHFGETNAHFVIENEHIQSVGVEVYLIFREPTEEYLTEINEQIRYNSQRRMPDKYFAYRNDDLVAHVNYIRDVEVAVDRLDPDRAKKANEFFPAHNFPEKFGYRIPPGAAPLVSMFESLSKALAVQDRYRSALEETVQSVQSLAKTSSK